MANLLDNGDFLTDLSSWIADPLRVVWDGDYQYHTPGSAKFDLVFGANNDLLQEIETLERGWYRLKFALYHTGLTAPCPFGVRVYSTGPDRHIDTEVLINQMDRWEVWSFDAVVPIDNSVCIYFYVSPTVDQADGIFYLDDVVFENIEWITNSCIELAWELKKRRRDWGCVKHFDARYQEVINQAIDQSPRGLWPRRADELTTVENQRRYSLAGIAAIVAPDQVWQVFIDDASDEAHELEIGRWFVEDDDGVLTLVLDNDPPDADRTITIYHIDPPSALDCEDEDETAEVDREWLLAKAMTILLTEADPTLESPEQIAQDLTIWDMRRQARERQEGRRWQPRKIRTQRWRA